MTIKYKNTFYNKWRNTQTIMKPTLIDPSAKESFEAVFLYITRRGGLPKLASIHTIEMRGIIYNGMEITNTLHRLPQLHAIY